MAKLKGLGKGLDALFSASNISAAIVNLNNSSSDKGDNGTNYGQLHNIELSAIKTGKYQPRKVFDESELQELANSIKQNGVIQPIVLRKIAVMDRDAAVNYELIAGERRYRASKMVHLTHIPAIIREFSDEEALAIALIENIQRRDLSVIEESKCYKRLIDEFHLTHEKLSKVTGRSRSHITNMLRLLNLQADVQEMLLLGKLTMGHARALLSLSPASQKKLALEIIVNNLTTNQVELQVAKLLATAKQAVGKAKAKDVVEDNSSFTMIDPRINNIEAMFKDKLGLLANVSQGRHGQGKITIKYSSLDELDNILQLF